MDDLRVFFSLLVRELEERRKADPAKFVSDFNNDLGRTRLMLGDGEDRDRVLKAAIAAVLKPKELQKDQWGFVPHDLIAYDGDWWLGQRVALVIVEVENRIDQFKGHVSDLIRTQAHQKIAVFYEDDLTSKELQSRETEIRGVLAYHFGKGFCEARDTEYLVVFGPTTVTEEGIGVWRGIWFTSDWQKSAFL